MTTPTTTFYCLRSVARAELTVAVTAHTAAAAAQRRALSAEVRATEAAGEWAHLLEMLAQPGRPVPAAHVRKVARAAKVPAADLARVLAHAMVTA